uniref:Uncharacterized protein n=1 Tax=viral metagenome TaxID=1070528 RepID=A0A6C0JQP8_9ZZZZ
MSIQCEERIAELGYPSGNPREGAFGIQYRNDYLYKLLQHFDYFVLKEFRKSCKNVNSICNSLENVGLYPKIECKRLEIIITYTNVDVEIIRDHTPSIEYKFIKKISKINDVKPRKVYIIFWDNTKKWHNLKNILDNINSTRIYFIYGAHNYKELKESDLDTFCIDLDELTKEENIERIYKLFNILSSQRCIEDLLQFFVEKGFDIKKEKEKLLIMSLSNGYNRISLQLLLNFDFDKSFTYSSVDKYITKDVLEMLNQKKILNYEVMLKTVLRTNRLSVITYLIKKIDVNRQLIDNKSILYYAIYEKSSISIIRLLIVRGADVNYTNGMSILYRAYTIFNVDKPILELLIQKGADVNFVYNGNSILFSAINLAHNLKPLVNNGADVNFVCDGKSVLYRVLESYYYGYDDINFLIQKGANVNFVYNDIPILYLSFKRTLYEDFIKLFLDNKLQIDSVEYKTHDVLMYVMDSDLRYKTKIFNFLIQNGANVNVKNNKGETLLKKANDQNENMIKNLLKFGAIE